MKRIAMLFVVFLSIFMISQGASAYTITDDYIGADPNSSSYDGKDLIGEPNLFGVSQMDVNFAGGQMIVDIYSTYFNNVGKYDTQLGDLFISVDGYNPVIPSQNDYYYNGEAWEYAIALDNHTVGYTSGAVNVNPVDNGEKEIGNSNTGDIILSSAPSGYIYRTGQEVQVASGLDSLGTGTWAFSTPLGDSSYLRIIVDMRGTAITDYDSGKTKYLYDWTNVTDYGFHWTMTCANDVIEGGVSVPVPEPGTMLLLGFGLIGLAGYRKYKA